MPINTLLKNGALRIAAQPPRNWQDVSTNRPLTVPLIAEDYPARTALMWNAAYEQLGMPDRNSMMLGDPESAQALLTALREDSRYVGGGAGVGFKVAVMPWLDELTPLAQAMGAVNIIKKVGGALVGHNTDGTGYALSLEQLLNKSGKQLAGAQVLMLGAGGTGRAIGFALAGKGVRLSILNRTASKAAELADAINRHFDTALAWGGGREHLGQRLPIADAVVSVIDDAHSPLDAYSPLGDMAAAATPESAADNNRQSLDMLKSARPDTIVSDIRIRKEQLPMLRQAASLGLPTLDGIPMVTYQAIEAFWWIYGTMLEARGVTQHQVAEAMWSAKV